MTQEERNLLFKDLSARLPYVVRGVYKTPGIEITCQKLTYDIIGNLEYKNNVEFKPYLFPLSSMTEEQLLELVSISSENSIDSSLKTLDWCYRNHYDVCNLIPMGLAIDATGLNIY